jgi:hypothetical protein
MHDTSREERPGCRETMVLTRAVFAVLLPPLVAMFAVLGLLSLTIVFFAIHPALALLPLAAIAVGFLLFARWEHGRARPPGH